MHSVLPLFAMNPIDIDTYAPQPHKLTVMQSSLLICAPVSFTRSIIRKIRGWLWHTFAHYQYYSKSFCFHHLIFARCVVTAILPISPHIWMPFKGLQGFIHSEAQLLSTFDTNNHLGLLWHLSGMILWSGSPQLNCNKLWTNFVSQNNLPCQQYKYLSLLPHPSSAILWSRLHQLHEFTAGDILCLVSFSRTPFCRL